MTYDEDLCSDFDVTDVGERLNSKEIGAGVEGLDGVWIVVLDEVSVIGVLQVVSEVVADNLKISQKNEVETILKIIENLILD